MSETIQALEADDPLMIAWNAYKETAQYINSKRWASHTTELEGSLWAMYAAGYTAGKQTKNGHR